jgi:TonB family protein
VSVLVVLSFGLGVAVGHGSFDRWLGTVAGGPPRTNYPQGGQILPAAKLPAGPARTPPLPAENRNRNGEGRKPESAAKPSATPATKGDRAPGLTGSQSANQAATPSVASSAVTSVVRENAGSKFSQAEHTISASGTTAITSRRSVILPSVNAVPIQSAGFHFGALTDHTDPSYPPDAIDKGIEGTVELVVAIGRDGSVMDVEATSGPSVLIPPAIAAVRIWHYKPTYVNGHAVETSDMLRVTFRLPH